MEEIHKNLIQKEYDGLRSALCCQIKEVATDLRNKQIFTKSMFQDIVEAHPTSLSKTGALLDLITQRGPDAFEELYQSVVKFELFDAANLLKPEINHWPQHGINANFGAGNEKMVFEGEGLHLPNKGDIGDKFGNPSVVNPNELPSLNSVKNGLPDNKANSNTDRPRSIALSNNNPNLKMNHDSTTPNTSSCIDSIASLTPEKRSWRIRAKVSMKSSINSFNKSKGKGSKGKGRVFDVTLTDKSGEIKCKAFDGQVDRYHAMLQVNKVYYFSKCTVKPANKQYSTHDYEMTMNQETVIESCNDGEDLPTLSFKFVKISDLKMFEADSTVDVVGIVTDLKDPTSVTSKRKKIKKLQLQLRDQSGVAVDLTLWGNDAPKFNVQGFPVIAVKGARVSDFNGRSLSVSGSCQLIVNPKLPEAVTLRSWFETGGREQQFSTFQGIGDTAGNGHAPDSKTSIQTQDFSNDNSKLHTKIKRSSSNGPSSSKTPDQKIKEKENSIKERSLVNVNLDISGGHSGDKTGNSTYLGPSEIPPLHCVKDESPGQRENCVQTSKALTAKSLLSKHFEESPDISNNKPDPKINNNSIAPNKPSSCIDSIASLTPDKRNWRIRAKVLMKSSIRTCKGKMKVFDVTLTDTSGEIKCTGFGEQVVKYYDMLQDNKVYYISKCTVKKADKKYSPLKSDYEMTMNQETVIETCNDGEDLPTMTFKFVKISDLNKFKEDSIVDVVGVVTDLKDPTSVTSKRKKHKIRELQLRDQSGMAVDLTLWGDDAPKFKVQRFSVIAVKGAKVKVSDFKGRSLSVQGSCQLIVNPNISEAVTLRSWFETGDREQQFSTFKGEGESAGDHASTK